MIKFTDSDIFQKMNRNDGITNKIKTVLANINETTMVNDLLKESMVKMVKSHPETITNKAVDAISDKRIIVVVNPVDRRLPANMPYVTATVSGKLYAIVDISKYATVKRDSDGELTAVECDAVKLYNMVVPALLAMEIFTPDSALASTSLKWLSIMWAKLFNKVLIADKVFVGSKERYDTFMYFAMKFFLIHYAQAHDSVVNKIADEYIGKKNPYLLKIESNLAAKGINPFVDWTTFAKAMFSNDITNITNKKNTTDTGFTLEYYLGIYSKTMGRDGAYMALWSVDYFFYCLFITYNKAYILNDRNWEDVFDGNRGMTRLMTSLYSEL